MFSFGRLLRAMCASLPAVVCMAAGSIAMADGCDRLDVSQFTGQVPYFSRQMTVVGETSSRDIAFVLPEDSRITVKVHLTPFSEPSRMTRADFVRSVSQRLQDDAGKYQAAGDVVETGLFPYDPIAWTMTRHTKLDASGDDVHGQLTVRVSPTCRLMADWNATTLPVLQGPVQKFGAAIDALRTFSERYSAPSEFVTDDYVPTGSAALGLNFGLPLLLDLVLVFLLRGMAQRGPMAAQPKAIAMGASIVIGVCILLQVSAYGHGFSQSLYLDNALVLGFALVLCVMTFLTGSPGVALAAFCSCMVFGLAILVNVFFGWVPNLGAGVMVGLAMLAAAAGGFWTWGQASQPTVRTVKRQGDKVLS